MEKKLYNIKKILSLSDEELDTILEDNIIEDDITKDDAMLHGGLYWASRMVDYNIHQYLNSFDITKCYENINKNKIFSDMFNYMLDIKKLKNGNTNIIKFILNTLKKNNTIVESEKLTRKIKIENILQ